ncbi:MAG: NAD(P)-dependent oxidoreductase [Bacteroidota bacterium]
MNVTFIGLGIMGSRMANNILSLPEVSLTVYNRSAEKAAQLKAAGATVATNLAEAVQYAEIVVTMLSTPEVVAALAASEQGFLAAMKQGSLWVDQTTVAPEHSRRFANLAKAHQVRFVEAPVLGSRAPAEAGELVVLAGGDAADVAEAHPLLDAVGKLTNHLGEVGKAASMKLLVNYMLAQSVAAFSEAVSLGINLGLEQTMIHNVLTNAPVSAPVLGVLRGKLESKDTTPNFPLYLMHKDLRLVADAAYTANTPLPLANAAKELYAQANAAGLGDEDFSTLYHHLVKEQ